MRGEGASPDLEERIFGDRRTHRDGELYAKYGRVSEACMAWPTP